jgi:hypothetical protein
MELRISVKIERIQIQDTNKLQIHFSGLGTQLSRKV